MNLAPFSSAITLLAVGDVMREVVGVVYGLHRVSGCKEATTHRVVAVIVCSEQFVRHLMVDGCRLLYWDMLYYLSIQCYSLASTYMRSIMMKSYKIENSLKNS